MLEYYIAGYVAVGVLLVVIITYAMGAGRVKQEDTITNFWILVVFFFFWPIVLTLCFSYLSGQKAKKRKEGGAK